jgi:thermitase
MATDGPTTPNDPSADPCTGCGGNCSGETPEECRGPAPLPWLDPHRCMFFYEGRVFAADRFDDRLRRVELRVIYQHCLRLLGRVQGGLLYTTTLLPGETVDVYEYDRFRRVRSEEERVSVHSSFRQTVSALSQTRRFADASAYVQTVTDVRTQTDRSISVGGGLAGFFGGPSGSASVSTDVETTVASGASLHTVTDSFTQNAITSAQATDAERSVVVSRFEDAEHQQATRRTLRNDNECYAVTYFVRGVSEAYEVTTRVLSIEWRVGETPWRDIADQDGPGTGDPRGAQGHPRGSPEARRVAEGRAPDHAAHRRHALRGRARALLVVRADARGGPCGSTSSRSACARAARAWRPSCSNSSSNGAARPPTAWRSSSRRGRSPPCPRRSRRTSTEEDGAVASGVVEKLRQS